MCLLAFAWRRHRRYEFVFAGNRDEFYARPAAPAAWWPAPSPERRVLAGRDLAAGGTWLGLRADGAFAAVTNVRAADARRQGERSRGELVTAFLTGAPAPGPGTPTRNGGDHGAAEPPPPQDPLAFASRLANHGSDYAHFNLVAGRLREPASVAYVNNVDGAASTLAEGVHVLSNHRLNTPWPKALRARAGLLALLEDNVDEPDAMITALLDLFADRTPAPDGALPSTGLDLPRERALSAPFIATDGYGTRCTTVILCARDGDTHFVEQSYDERGAPAGRVAHRFALSAPVTQ